MPHVSVASATFPQCFLRLDGSGVTTSTNNGSGTVNCQSGVGPYETLVLDHPAGQPSDVFTIGSTAFSQVFLRMDSSSVHGFDGNGGGIVNCQFTPGPYEHFRFETQTDGTRAIASVNFPGTYLRMDGTGVHSADNGSGTVNCQGSVGPYEKFLVSEVK